MFCGEIITVCSQIHKKTHNLNYIWISSPYRAVNTLRLDYKNRSLMLCGEIIAVCSQIYTEHINKLCGQNVEFLVLQLVLYIVTKVFKILRR